MIKRILKYTLYILLALLLFIQFFHPEKNISNDQTNHLSTKFPLPDSIEHILKTACYDCHSNYTEYPWYSKIQPVDWWLTDHINHGKRALNFSEFAKYRIYRQYGKLESINKAIAKKTMPLPSYLIIHKDAEISETQREQIKKWTGELREIIKASNPADSLVKPEKKK